MSHKRRAKKKEQARVLWIPSTTYLQFHLSSLGCWFIIISFWFHDAQQSINAINTYNNLFSTTSLVFFFAWFFLTSYTWKRRSFFTNSRQFKSSRQSHHSLGLFCITGSQVIFQQLHLFHRSHLVSLLPFFAPYHVHDCAVVLWSKKGFTTICCIAINWYH